MSYQKGFALDPNIKKWNSRDLTFKGRGTGWMESSPKEKEFGGLLDGRLDMALAAQKAKYIPGCFKNSEQKVKGRDSPP